MKIYKYLSFCLLFTVFQLNTHTNATENMLYNEILNYLNQEDETIISTAKLFDVPINKVLSIYKKSNEIIEPVINIIKDNTVSADELKILINNINRNNKKNITMDDIENIAYKSDNLANIISFINIDKTIISQYHQSDKDILDCLNRTGTNINIANLLHELEVNIPKKIVLEIYLKSSPIVIEVYKEISRQYYHDNLKPNNFWTSLRKNLQDHFNDKSYIYTSDFTEYINTILYKLDQPWYKFKEVSYIIASEESDEYCEDDDSHVSE